MSTLEIMVTGAQTVSGMPPAVQGPPLAQEQLASERLSRLLEIRLSAPAGAVTQRIVSSLSELADGWSGPDSVPPSPAVLADIQSALEASWLSAEPSLEVDTDGSVSLVWTKNEEILALTFVGNGQVVGSVFPQNESGLPWALPAGAKHEIASRLAEREVANRLL